MYYISRRTDRWRWGVVDTDTDKEMIVSKNWIRDTVCEKRIPIVGVSIVDDEYSARLGTIVPHQDERYVTPLMLKTKLLLGVDITVWRGEITRIEANGRIVRNNSSIRLSDYGSQMNWLAYSVWIQADQYMEMTLILDDNIKMMGSISDILSSTSGGMYYDITEMTDDELIGHWYSDYTHGIKSLNEFLIDRRDRR